MRTTSLLSFLLLPALLAGEITTGKVAEPDAEFQFKLSGTVAGRLPDVCSVKVVPFWGEPPYPVWHIDEMPFTLPRERLMYFNGQKNVPCAGYVLVGDRKGNRIVGVQLSADLFDKPRMVDLVLERPKTFVRPADVFGDFGFRYHALISQRMQYFLLPRWDAEKQEFLSPSAPFLRIYNADTTELLFESEMWGMCFGHGWATNRIDLPADMANKTQLDIVVTHDTGDLFGQLKTECSFTYSKNVHGRVTEH